jgi:hypothetical protein
MDMKRGEVMNTFAFFPGDRFVGDGAEGEFTVKLTDLEGNPVGSAFDEWPQMTQAFGEERRQATVSGTTSRDPDPVPETVLIGFEWHGPPGQESEIRFEADASFDPERKQAADRIEAEGDGQDSNDESPSATSPVDSGEDADSAATDEEPGGGGFSFPVAIGVLVTAALGVLVVRRVRAR